MLALKFGIPTIGLNYDPKVESLCEQAGIPCLPLTRLSLEDLKQARQFVYPSKQTLHKFAIKQANLSKEQNGLLLRNLVSSLITE